MSYDARHRHQAAEEAGAAQPESSELPAGTVAPSSPWWTVSAWWRNPMYVLLPVIHFLLTILINSAYWRRRRPREGRSGRAAHPVSMEMPVISSLPAVNTLNAISAGW